MAIVKTTTGNFSISDTFLVTGMATGPSYDVQNVHVWTEEYQRFRNSAIVVSDLLCKVSDSTQPWFASKSGCVLLPPKKMKIDWKRYLRVPVKPLYNPPKQWPKWAGAEPVFQPFKPPYPFTLPASKDGMSQGYYSRLIAKARSRYNNHMALLALQHEQKHTERVLKHREKVASYEARRAAYDRFYQRKLSDYERLYARYLKRLAFYQEYLKRKPRLLVVNGLKAKTLDKDFKSYRLVSDDQSLKLHTASRWPYPVIWNNPPNVELCTILGSSLYPGLTPVLTNDYRPLRLDSDQKVFDCAHECCAAIDEAMTNLLVDRITELDSKLLWKLSSKVRKADFHVGNIIAQRAQTYSLLRDAVDRLASLSSGKKRLVKSITSFFRNPRKIADDFLAFKFGVEPLLSDVYQLGVRIAEWTTSDDNDWFAFRVNGRFYLENEVISTPYGSYTVSGMVEISYTAKYAITDGSARLLSELGLVNPAEIAWEMLPWSFVIDWIVPVSDWLESHTDEVGIEFQTGTRKIRKILSVTSSSNNQGTQSLVSPLTWTGGADDKQALFSGNFSLEFKDRQKLSSLPSAACVPIKNPMSLTHLFEALALSVQRLFR